MRYRRAEPVEAFRSFFRSPLVPQLMNSQHNSIVIPGNLAIASATRNPEFQRHLATGFRRYAG